MCSGNAFALHYLLVVLTVYPRVFGERVVKHSITEKSYGLSPCVRGTRSSCFVNHIFCRFIPVCSGNARSCSRSMRVKAVYPRVFGERRYPVFTWSTKPGLSPCVRGTLITVGTAVPSERFIPVCSGNAFDELNYILMITVYPRVFGERWRGRGLRCCNLRFIPVCSGNAHSNTRVLKKNAVYPRVFGERIMTSAEVCYNYGLSPCVRGTLTHTTKLGTNSRFIPVCSGNAPYPTTGAKAMTVYPRVFGERGILRA